jgi:hypothetical protein
MLSKKADIKRVGELTDKDVESLPMDAGRTIIHVARLLRLCVSSLSELCQVPHRSQRGDELVMLMTPTLKLLKGMPFGLRRCESGHKVVGACYITGLQETWKCRSYIEALLENFNLV